MIKLKHAYNINPILIEELESSFTPEQTFIHIKYNKKCKFAIMRIDDSYGNSFQKEQNLPSVFIGFRYVKSRDSSILVGQIVQSILESFSGFTPEQECLIKIIADICNEQDAAFIEADKIQAAKDLAWENARREKEAQYYEELEKKYEQKRKEEFLANTRIVATDDNGIKVSKDRWMELYDRAKDNFPRTEHEQRAVIYNNTLYCNAARALMDYEMNTKRGDELYKACERGHKYAGHTVHYATAEQILAYVEQAFPDEEPQEAAV